MTISRLSLVLIIICILEAITIILLLSGGDDAKYSKYDIEIAKEKERARIIQLERDKLRIEMKEKKTEISYLRSSVNRLDSIIKIIPAKNAKEFDRVTRLNDDESIKYLSDWVNPAQ